MRKDAVAPTASLAIAALLQSYTANAAGMIFATIEGSRQGLLKGDTRDKTEV